MTEAHFETPGLHAMGDRLALINFCQLPENLGDQVVRLREELNKRGKRDVGGLPTSGHPMLKRPAKESLKLEFGWKHQVKGTLLHIRKNKGGGNRTAHLLRSCQYKDCLKKAQELFFPDMNSQYGKFTDMEATLCKFNGIKVNEAEFTVEKYRKDKVVFVHKDQGEGYVLCNFYPPFCIACVYTQVLLMNLSGVRYIY